MRFGMGALLSLLVLACAQGAQAATHYASPSGSGTACTQAMPCTPQEAAAKAKTNDEVILASGAYSIGSSPILIPSGSENVSVHGDLSGPMPQIDAHVSGGPIAFEDTGGRLTYLKIVNEAPGAFGVSCVFEGVVERVDTLARGSGAVGLHQGPGCSVRDSLLRAEGDGAIALHTTDSETSELRDAVARNLTAIATGPNSFGVRAEYLGVGPTFEITLLLKNTIASGATYDLYATGIGNKGRIIVDHSNFHTSGTDYDGITGNPEGEILADSTNQSAPPLFVDAAAGDFREAAGSPTIDAGELDELPGLVDLAGAPRIIGDAVDIGAFEFAPGPPPPPPPAPMLGEITSLRVKPKKFAALEDGLGAKDGEKGAVVSYRLTAPAGVRFGVERKSVGRIVKGKCRRKTRFNAYGKPCPLFVREKRSFSRSGRGGTNRFRFLGRLGSKALEPGIYRLVASAGGATRRAPFRVVD
jgi:hypothetical protein